MGLEIEEVSVDAMRRLWFRKHSAEGYVVISHPEYGDIPAWNEEIAMALVSLINYGSNARAEIIDDAISTLSPKQTAASRRCWFDFEGEDKGDDIESDSDEQAAKIHYGTWVDEVDEGTRIFVRSTHGVTEWSVCEEKQYVARQLNIREQ